VTQSSIEYATASSAGDRAQAVAFYRRMFQTSSRVVDLYEWIIQDSDASGGLSTFLARSDGEVVGAMNLVPVTVRVHGRKLSGCWQQDSIVSKSMRGQGVGRELINRSATAFDIVLAKGTSEAMYGLRKACGFRDAPNANYLVKILDPLRTGPSVKHKAFGAALAAVSLLQRRFRRTTVETRTLNRFDEAFDRLAEEPATGDVRPVKGSRYLNWRYGTCPGREYTIIGSLSRTGVSGGVVVTTRQTAWIVDLLCDHADADSLVSLVRSAVECCRRSGSASVHTFATSQSIRNVLRQEGFVEIPRTPHFTFRGGVPGSEIDEELRPELGWAFHHGDGDIELYDE
jgi:GNAT superfamily N-acetyltransferase